MDVKKVGVGHAFQYQNFRSRARLAECPAAVIRWGWHEPIVREAVEARRDEISAQLRCNEGEPGEGMPEPSAVYHLTREEIALIR